MRIKATAVLAAVLFTGCSSSAATPTSPSPAAIPSPAASASPTTVSPPTPSEPPPASPSGSQLGAKTAVLATADFVLREQPAESSDPAGTVPGGSTAWIAAETVAAGATWFQLVPLEADVGWVSGWLPASPDGASLEPLNLGCDSIGVSASLLANLSMGDRLACYAEPFTFAARIVDCNCDIDGGFVEPQWLGIDSVTGPGGDSVTALLVDEEQTMAPPNTEDWLLLRLDPAATVPDPLPFLEVVEITAQFDHPSAATCVIPEGVENGPSDPVLECRISLAVTGIKAVD